MICYDFIYVFYNNTHTTKTKLEALVLICLRAFNVSFKYLNDDVYVIWIS